MRKFLTLTAALCALLALTAVGFASAAGEGPVSVKVGNLELTADGGFSPKALSKKTPEPISLTAEGSIRTLDGTHPPAAKEIIVETDKGGFIDTKGIPTCSSGQLQSRETKAAEKACPTAIIGDGQANVEVEFPEQKPIQIQSKLLVFNGGTSGGKTTLYIHAYLTSPVAAAIVTTLKISKHPNGPYGLKTVASIPKIAGGSGSVTKFTVNLDKNVKVGGKTYNPLTLKCTDGKVDVGILAKFSDGTQAKTSFVRACTPKG